MMRDIYVETMLACGAISALAATVSILKAARDYVSGKMFPAKPQVFVALPTTTGSIPSASVVKTEAAEEITNPIEPPSNTPTPIRTPESMESVFPPLTNTPVPVSSAATLPHRLFSLECGSCHKQIKSGPIKKVTVGGKSQVRYKCEHCNAIVGVNAD